MMHFMVISFYFEFQFSITDFLSDCDFDLILKRSAFDIFSYVKYPILEKRSIISPDYNFVRVVYTVIGWSNSCHNCHYGSHNC